jgi:hypothetical protein
MAFLSETLPVLGMIADTEILDIINIFVAKDRATVF